MIDALTDIEPIIEALKQYPEVLRIELVGSLRRFCETVADADLLIATHHPEAVLDHLVAYSKVVRTVERRPTSITVRLSDGLYVDLKAVAPAEFAPALLRETGSFAHVKHLEELAAEKKESLSASAPDERDIYSRLGLPYIPPELREDHGEIEAARFGSLPEDLVTLDDIRGLVHCHTVYSDGKNTVEEMARAADALGMQYLTITDHSPTAHYAGGVTIERLQQQWDEIARVQKQVKVRLLRGTESDILGDGELDYPLEILQQFDVIVASIHSRMKMDEDAMTRRLLNAMRQPVFKIWGHALGRLILRRPPFACRVEEVLDAVAESRAAIEINGDPHRLDLAPEWVQKARARGIRFVISTDAHSINGFNNLQFGVHMARRGWLRKDEVLNTLDAEAFARAVKPAL
jgi:DNA polymerase (family 10)